MRGDHTSVQVLSPSVPRHTCVPKCTSEDPTSPTTQDTQTTHTHMQACTCTHTHTHAHTDMHMHEKAHACARINRHMRTHRHTHKHAQGAALAAFSLGRFPRCLLTAGAGCGLLLLLCRGNEHACRQAGRGCREGVAGALCGNEAGQCMVGCCTSDACVHGCNTHDMRCMH